MLFEPILLCLNSIAIIRLFQQFAHSTVNYSQSNYANKEAVKSGIFMS